MDFKNTIIILTSNLGSDIILEDLEKNRANGKNELSAEARDKIDLLLKRQFRPEFLNRIDDIIVFRALTEQNIEEVARRMLKTVADRMETMDIHLDASDEAVKELAKEGFDPKYGARPLRRAIQSTIADQAAGMLLDGTLQQGDVVTAEVRDGKIVLTKTRERGTITS